MVTAGTYHREHLFRSRKRLRHLTTQLLSHAGEFSWTLEAWSVLSNHYHFIAKNATAAFQRTVLSFPIDRLKITDDF